MQCNTCQESFHEECTGAKKDDNYTCAPCNLSQTHGGAVWSEKKASNPKDYIDNTCPIDGSLTGAAIHGMAQNPLLRSQFPKDREHQALTNAMNELRKNNSHAAQTEMYNLYRTKQQEVKTKPEYRDYSKKIKDINKKNQEIEKKNLKKSADKQTPLLALPDPIDLPYPEMDLEQKDIYGEPRQLWPETLRAGCTFEAEVECTKCDIKNTEYGNISTPSVEYFHMQPDDSPSLAIGKSVYGSEYKCPKPNCDGTVTQGPLQQPKNLENWMLHLDLQSMPEDKKKELKDEVFTNQFPKEMKVGDATYQFSHMTLLQEGHFTSLHYDPQSKQLAYYDGKACKRPQATCFRKAARSDLQNKTPVAAEYYIMPKSNQK